MGTGLNSDAPPEHGTQTTGQKKGRTGVRQILCSESIVVNSGEGEKRAITLFCRSWKCEICQPKRKAALIALAQGGKPTTFITLTTNPAIGASPIARARALADAWRLIVKRAKKRYGLKKLPYMCVFEATKRGEPHLHILARVKWLDQKWLSQQMASINGAPVVDIRRVKSAAQIGAYVAKYVGKAPHQFGTSKRYWCTRDYDLSTWERDEEPGRWRDRWSVEGITLATQNWLWRQRRWVVWEEDGMLYASDPWRGFHAAREGRTLAW